MKTSNLIIVALWAGGATAQSFADRISSIPELSNISFYVGQNPELRSVFDSRNVTILAPEDSAFHDLVGMLQVNATEPLPNATGIRGILEYHIVNGTHPSTDFNSTPRFLSTHLTNPGFTNVSGGQVVQIVDRDGTLECISGLNAQARFVRSDLRYDDGIIHIIDQVLTLPQSTTATLFAANLTAALGALRVGGTSSLFNNRGNITVFAPTNHGFARIASVLQNQNVSPSDLSRITRYHVVQGPVLYSTDLRNATLSTLAGENLTVSVINGTAFINSARVESTDVLINNGVMHVISDVLNPDNTTVRPDPRAETQAVAFGGASSGSLDALTSGQPTPTTVIPLFPAGSISGGPTSVPPPATTTTTTSPTTTQSPSPPTETTGAPPGGGCMETPPAGVAVAVALGALLLHV